MFPGAPDDDHGRPKSQLVAGTPAKAVAVMRTAERIATSLGDRDARQTEQHQHEDGQIGRCRRSVGRMKSVK